MHPDPMCQFVEFPRDEIEGSLGARFERQVDRHANRIAVRAPSQTLTYEALNRQVNRIAHAILARRGPGQEPVVLLLQDGVVMTAAILAVLKSSKIVVVLECTDPPARQSHILQDTQPGLLLSDRANLYRTQQVAPVGCQTIAVEDLGACLSTENPKLPVSPDALAQIIYTSGSTGQPKGVMLGHRYLLHYIMGYTNALRICPNDRHMMVSPFIHTAGISQMFRALLNGAALCLYNLRERGVADLPRWLRDEAITMYHSVPTVFRHLANTLSGHEVFPKLRLAHLGGEPLTSRDVGLFRRHFPPDCILLNSLGCTEALGFRRLLVGRDTPIGDHIVPGGYAVADKKVLLLDEDGKPVADGQVGEIAVQSAYLAVGYWRDPELTQQKFLADPEGGKERIFLTGDVGRMRPDGCLEYHGRRDAQVKVRGHRVEPAEVELALLDFDGIREATVVAHELLPGDTSLVAYLVTDGASNPASGALRAWVAERVPPYMVPSTFIFLEEMPLTGSGKLDRRRLPAPKPPGPDAERTPVPPRTPTEKALAGIWAQVFGLERVGAYDSFFELGGHSLLAAQILSRVEALYQVQLPSRSIFETPTVAGMALALDKARAAGVPLRQLGIPSVARQPRRTGLP